MPHVISTLSSDNCYTDWERPEADGEKVRKSATARMSVTIKGGANVAGKLYTPEGVATSVTDDQLAFLKSNKNFIAHEKNGFVKVVTARNPDADKAAKDMTDRDESAPLNVEKGDFEEGGRAAGISPTAKVE